MVIWPEDDESIKLIGQNGDSYEETLLASNDNCIKTKKLGTINVEETKKTKGYNTESQE